MKRALPVIIGLIAGLALAFVIGRVLWPMERYNPTPAALRQDYRDEYVRLVSLAYQADGDLTLAQGRLQVLQADNFTAPLVNLAERWIARGDPDSLILPLAYLARDLDALTPNLAAFLERAEL